MPQADESKRLEKMQVVIEPPRREETAAVINEDRWKESQLEEPERWDGMS